MSKTARSPLQSGNLLWILTPLVQEWSCFVRCKEGRTHLVMHSLWPQQKVDWDHQDLIKRNGKVGSHRLCLREKKTSLCFPDYTRALGRVGILHGYIAIWAPYRILREDARWKGQKDPKHHTDHELKDVTQFRQVPKELLVTCSFIGNLEL